MGVEGKFLSQELKPVLMEVNAFHVIFGLMVAVDLSWLIHALIHAPPSKHSYDWISDAHLFAYLMHDDRSGIADVIFYWFLDKFQYQPHGFLVISEERATQEKDLVLAQREAIAKKHFEVVQTSHKKGKAIERADLEGAFRRSVKLTAAIATLLQKIGVRVVMSVGETDHQVNYFVSILFSKHCLLSFVNVIGR